MESFAPWLERIEKHMTERALDEITRSIPPEWYADDYDALLGAPRKTAAPPPTRAGPDSGGQEKQPPAVSELDVKHE
jgi:hypothetical protein